MEKNGTNILLKDIYINPWKYKDINSDLVSLLNLSLGNVDFVFIESNGRSQILNTDTSNDLLLGVFQEFEEKYDHKESVLEDNFKGRKILDLNNLNIPKDLHVAILEELKKFDDSIIEQCADRLKSSITKQQNFEKINFPKEIEKHLRGIASVDIEANVISKDFKHRIDLKIKQFESSEETTLKKLDIIEKHVKNETFENIHFENIYDVLFENCQFKNCSFEGASLCYVYFDKCEHVEIVFPSSYHDVDGVHSCAMIKKGKIPVLDIYSREAGDDYVERFPVEFGTAINEMVPLCFPENSDLILKHLNDKFNLKDIIENNLNKPETNNSEEYKIKPIRI